MKTISKFFIIFLSSLFLTSAGAVGLPTVSLSPVIEKVSPAVVNIRAQIKINYDSLSRLQQRNLEDSPLPDVVLSVASGVIVDAAKGYILTNSHVVDDAQSVMVTLSDGRHFNAKIIGMDKPSDVAVIQIPAKNLTAIELTYPNKLKVGDLVIAIGNPFGLNQTVSSGIVSALGRTALGIENYENFIQTDAPINPGNSGGALINSTGQLVGINTAILAPSRGSIGIGFAIPANMAKSVMQQLIEFGNVKRGALGVGAQDISPELATGLNLNSTKGAVVTLVMPNSPAELAGIKIGDIITSVNNSEIKNANDVVNSIAFMRVNSKAAIQILRDNKSLTFSILITDPKKRLEADQQMDPLLYGVGLKNFSVLAPQQGNVNGVLVISVLEDSNAWQSDLRPGDVIISANKQPVTNIDELKKISKNASSLILNVLRGPGAVFLVINKDS